MYSSDIVNFVMTQFTACAIKGCGNSEKMIKVSHLSFFSILIRHVRESLLFLY